MLSGSLARPKRPSTALIGETPFSAGSNSGTLAELELVDHLAGEIARQDDLRLARHRLLVDRAASLVLVGVGPQIDVVAPLDEDARLPRIAGRDQLNGDKREQPDKNRRPQDLPFLAPQRRAERRQIELAVGRASGAGRRRRRTHRKTPRNKLADRPQSHGRSQTIKVAIRLKPAAICAWLRPPPARSV